MREFAQKLLTAMGKDDAVLRRLPPEPGVFSPVPGSLHRLGKNLLLTGIREGMGRVLLIVSECRKQQPDGFEGEEFRLDDGGVALCCADSHRNAVALRNHFHWCAPSVAGGGRPTVELGSGDEIAAQLQAVRGTGLTPVLPVSADRAVFEIFANDYRDGFVIDGGRTAAAAGLEKALADGAGFVTLVSGTGETAGTPEEYAGKRFVLNSQTAVVIGPDAAERCVARFGGLVGLAAAACSFPGGKRAAFDPGIGLDDDDTPTPPAAHLYVIRELRKRNIDCAVLFPRYPEKPEEFDRSFRLHLAIARVYGDYKLALPLAGIPPERFRELRGEAGEMLHFIPDTAVWKQFGAYFPT